MRIVYIGAVKFSEDSLKKLIEIPADIAGVCTLEECRTLLSRLATKLWSAASSSRI